MAVAKAFSCKGNAGRVSTSIQAESRTQRNSQRARYTPGRRGKGQGRVCRF